METLPSEKKTRSTKGAELTEEQKAAEFKKKYSRRWRCKVEAIRRGDTFWEVTVPDPSNRDRPIPLKGHCGHWIEEGLPLHAIDCLQNAYYTETRERKAPSSVDRAVEVESVRVPLYRVTVGEEIENPKPIGRSNADHKRVVAL